MDTMTSTFKQSSTEEMDKALFFLQIWQKFVFLTRKGSCMWWILYQHPVSSDFSDMRHPWLYKFFITIKHNCCSVIFLVDEIRVHLCQLYDKPRGHWKTMYEWPTIQNKMYGFIRKLNNFRFFNRHGQRNVAKDDFLASRGILLNQTVTQEV